MSGCREHRLDVPRQRDVDLLRGEHALILGRLDLGSTSRERIADRSARLADALAGLLASLRRQCADFPIRQCQGRPVASVGKPGLFQLLKRLRGGDRSQRLFTSTLNLVGAQWRDLDGVVVGVGRGHAGLSRSESQTV